jgi:hypothetical protein
MVRFRESSDSIFLRIAYGQRWSLIHQRFIEDKTWARQDAPVHNKLTTFFGKEPIPTSSLLDCFRLVSDTELCNPDSDDIEETDA